LHTAKIFSNFAIGKRESWKTQEKHHEKPANNNCINNLRLKNYGRKILGGG
jgi:hypothetical protein